jgi:hypothetical protein
MKNKLIFSGIIAGLFATAMIVYKESLSLEGLILIFIGASGTITAVWKWLNAKESVSNLRQENHALRAMHKAEFRKNNLNINTMATLKGNLEIVKAQAEWIANYGEDYPDQSQVVLEQQVANLNLMIEAAKNDTLNPTLTPPPPTP